MSRYPCLGCASVAADACKTPAHWCSCFSSSALQASWGPCMSRYPCLGCAPVAAIACALVSALVCAFPPQASVMLSNDWISNALSPKLSGSCGAQKASTAADSAGCIHTSFVSVLHGAAGGLRRNAVAISDAAACADRPTSAVATLEAHAGAGCVSVRDAGSNVGAFGGAGAGALSVGGGVRVLSGSARLTPPSARCSVSGRGGGAGPFSVGGGVRVLGGTGRLTPPPACCSVGGRGGGAGALSGGGGVRVLGGTGRPTPPPACCSVGGRGGGAAVFSGGAGDSAGTNESASVSSRRQTGALSSASSLVSLTWLRTLSASESCAGGGMCVLCEPGILPAQKCAFFTRVVISIFVFLNTGLNHWDAGCPLYFGIFKHGVNYGLLQGHGRPFAGACCAGARTRFASASSIWRTARTTRRHAGAWEAWCARWQAREQ